MAALVLIAAAPGLTAVVVGPSLLDRRTKDLQAQVEALGEANDELAGALAASVTKADGLLVRVGALESTAEGQPDTAATAARVQDSVFTVTTGNVSGSAWVVGHAGAASNLITNYHVVSDPWKAGDRHVVLHAGADQWDGVIIDVSEGTDLAVIEVQASFPILERATGVPSVGDPVLAFGSPLGLDDTVSTGIVSAIRTEGFDDYIQFSAPVSPGSSGGPLVDAEGRVLGVTVMKAVAEGAEGLGFAIPIGVVCDVVAC
jgi:putative serine protease PepD